ncbi:uncharacterized protein [Rutidosis leptorrhynchoides]|uniref:uncharacterized protein n=1 Tax=Rutidosis leptorrhynchoides TaxID=125765 RepID=UPI003A99E919
MTKANETFVENVESNIGQKNIDHLVKQYPPLAGYNPVPPLPSQRAHQPPENKVAIYEHAFKHGNFRVPPTDFFLGVLDHFKVGLGQLHPYAIGKIVLFEMWCVALNTVPLVKVFCHLFRLANHHKSWFTFFARQNFTKTPKSNAGSWKETFFFVDQTVVGTGFPQTLIWCEKVEKDVNKMPALDDEEKKLLKQCVNAQLVHRSYGNVMLRLGKISAYWPWEDVRPAIVGPDGKEMRMKKVLTAEEIAGISFRKQDVDKQLEQAAASEHVEETPAESGNKRKAAGTSEAKGETERVRLELEKVTRERDDAVTNRELAEADMTKLRTALPAIAQKRLAMTVLLAICPPTLGMLICTTDAHISIV